MENGRLTDNLVLVTGGTGYIGTVLVPHLASLGYRVRTLDTQHFGNAIADIPGVESVKGDICDTETVRKALKGCEAVVHLAGIVTDDLVDMNRGLALRVNVLATQQLCELAAEEGVGRFLYASSSSVYGSSFTEPATEETRCAPETFYALTKYVAEQAALGFKDRMCVTAVRSATCFGPAPRMRLDTIVNVFCKQAYWDRVITVHGGTQWRSNVHVQDAAEFYGLLLTESTERVNGEAFNVVEHSRLVLVIAKEVRDAILTHSSFEYLSPEIQVDRSKRDTRHYRMSGEKAKRILNWSPNRDLAWGVRDNIGFFQSGGVKDPDDSLYFNTRRMEKLVKGAA